MTHQRIIELQQQGELEGATKVCLDMLNADRDDAAALFQLARIMLDQNNHGIAYHLLARGCKMVPDVPEMWLQYSRAHPDKPDWWGRAEWCLRKAIKLSDKAGKKMPQAWANLGMLRYIQGQYEEAQTFVDVALTINPEHSGARITQGFIHLARGEWDKAWTHYDLMLKTHKRESWSYGDEPEWDGMPGKRVIVSGEQGIGDEIMYASIFDELIRDCSEVVIECMPRLKGLFERSFPGATVYGTRWDKHVTWSRDHRPEAHVAMASLPKFYRHKDGDFHGRPYLQADPDMRSAFKGMLSGLSRKPKVGIAWTGGTDHTRAHLRTRTLEELTPLLRQDVTWVSLEYRDRTEEIAEYRAKRGIDIHVFDWITRKGLDYDMTAALVAELDLVITVPSSVSQTAGSLGVEAWVLIPKYSSWIWARPVFPWADSVSQCRNPPIKEFAERLSQWIGERSRKAA